MFPDPIALYTERLARYNAEQERLDQRSRRIGNLNLLLLFAAFVVLALAAFRSDIWLVALAVLLFVAFVGGLVMHNRVNRKLQAISLRAGLNRDGLARLARDWKALPAPLMESSPQPAVAIDPATAADLDLTGRASLAQLLGTPHTPIGKRTLQRWILTPASPATVRARQQSCAELAPQVDFREEVGVRGRLLESDEERYAQFVAWAEGESWLHAHRHWLWVARLLPLAVLAFFAAFLAGYPVLTPLLGLLLVNLFVLQSVGRKVGDAISRVAAQQGVFASYAGLFDLFTAHPVHAAGLRQLQERLAADQRSAGRQMRDLARWMPLVDIRRSIYFFPIEVATLWSFHVLWLLEHWQRSAGAHVREWL